MGKIWLVGAGPGDPDLITVKGLRLIEQADVILYDRLIGEELLGYAKQGAVLIYCGKLPDNHHMTQEEINQSLVDHAKSGKQVVRLKGGDPFIFGRGGEEAQAAVASGIDFEVVPGVTAGIAAPAYAGIPVTHREFSASYAIITGHRKDDADDRDRWRALAKGIDTLTIYMGIKNIAHIKRQLIRHGKDSNTPVAVIHWGTTSKQVTTTTTLGEVDSIILERGIVNPSIIVIGEVVKLHTDLQWFTESIGAGVTL